LRKRHPQWNQGQPDLVLSQPKEHTVPGEKTVDIVSFTLSPAELGTEKGDRYLQALEFRPSNRNLLHHAILYADNPRQPLAAWSMTDAGLRLPAGTAWLLRRQQPLTVELHYFKRNLRPARDLTRLALYFAKTKPTRAAYLIEATKPDIRIPAGANLHTEAMRFRLRESVHLHAILPLRLRPTGQSDWTLWVTPYEHHLMSSYVLARPLPLAQGSSLDLEATFDNSTQNEFNPHKTLREVIFAENGLDETFRFWLTVSRPIGIP
jgi:hypothetical protein